MTVHRVIVYRYKELVSLDLAVDYRSMRVKKKKKKNSSDARHGLYLASDELCLL